MSGSRDGFGRALRGEWTKLTTVRSTVWALGATVGLTVLICLLSASGSNTFVNDGPHSIDQFHFVHQPLTGDGSVVAQVSGQQDSHEWAKAGIMIKESVTSGSPAAVLMVTPRHGVRLQGNLVTEMQGSSSAAPRWLKLTRTGDSIAGHESADGLDWDEVGTIDLGGLPRTAQAGLFVTSPASQRLTRVGPGSIEVGMDPNPGQATFAHVSIGGGPAEDWSSQDIAPIRAGNPKDNPEAGPMGGLQPSQGTGSASEADGVFSVTGVGDIGQVGISGVKLEADSRPGPQQPGRDPDRPDRGRCPERRSSSPRSTAPVSSAPPSRSVRSGAGRWRQKPSCWLRPCSL